MNKPETTNELNRIRVRRVQEYIRRYYSQDLTLSLLAEQVNMAPTSLCHVFKQTTGMRVYDYITETRINQAARLLLETTLEVKAIVYTCGFNTQTNFNRHFKRLLGCTPTEYRLRQNNNQ